MSRASQMPYYRLDKQTEDETLANINTVFGENPEKGLALLFHKFYAPLCSHAVRLVYSKEIAEDMVSEVFFQFYRTKAYKNINSSYTSYLFRSVRNECYSYLNDKFRKKDMIDPWLENNISCSNPQPDMETHYNDLFLKVKRLIEKLPPRSQRIFLLSRFQNRKYHEIAEDLKISPKTVEVHISRALKVLRLALREELTISQNKV